MKRFTLFSLVVLGLALAMNAAAASVAVNTAAAPVQVEVGVLDLTQEVALLGQSEVTSVTENCAACLSIIGCGGGSGSVCSNDPRCTCQWCGGKLVCRPSGGRPFPHPEPIPDPEPVP